MSLVNEALTFPGIPIVARALAISMAAARQWPWRGELGALALVGVYLVVVIPLSGPILTHVFRTRVQAVHAVGAPGPRCLQLQVAAATGFLILLKADRRVHAIVLRSRSVTPRR